MVIIEQNNVSLLMEYWLTPHDMLIDYGVPHNYEDTILYIYE